MYATLNPDELQKLSKHELVGMVLSREEELQKFKDKYLTKKQALDYLPFKSESTLNQYIAKGIIQVKKARPDRPNSKVMIPFSEIVRFRNGQ